MPSGALVIWLLGGISAVGVAGVVALALSVIRMASTNRSDLKELAKLTRARADTAMLLAATENTKQDLENALLQRTHERDREHLARVATEELLQSALIELTHTDAGASIRADFKRLSEIVSPSNRAITSNDRGSGEAVHGKAGADSDPADQ